MKLILGLLISFLDLSYAFYEDSFAFYDIDPVLPLVLAQVHFVMFYYYPI